MLYKVKMGCQICRKILYLNIIVKYFSVNRKVLKEILQLPLSVQNSIRWFWETLQKLLFLQKELQNTTSLAVLSSILKEESLYMTSPTNLCSVSAWDSKYVNYMSDQDILRYLVAVVGTDEHTLPF